MTTVILKVLLNLAKIIYQHGISFLEFSTNAVLVS